jgi:outer membrane protein assembly factor BamB
MVQNRRLILIKKYSILRLFFSSTLALVIAFFLKACSPTSAKEKSVLVWDNSFPVIGSQSSPRTIDINKDGVLDIVMGAGKNEFQKSDMGIIALDGKTGALLWKQEAADQVYGSATFSDITGDKVKDVFIGGRSPQFKAIDGSSGRLLWEYKYEQYKNHPIMRYARFNFNNSVLVPDQNNDGIEDLLTINGGNAYAQPYSTKDRFPGVLMLLDSKTGNLIAADTMPDGKESYITPLCFTKPGSEGLFIVFGTGGETIDGNLYIATITQLLAKQLSGSKVVASEKGHGFIAPPTLADITGDGYLDIIAISHGSKAIAIDGKDDQVLWTKSFPGTECSNSFAVGKFTDDNIPDFFTFISKGQWPNSTGTRQIMLNGMNGNIEYSDSIGCTGFSSPVIYDLDGDGRDEAIMSVNNFDCSLGFASRSPTVIENRLIAIDFTKASVQILDQSPGYKNIFSTPWIGDLDHDNYLDIIYCQYYHHSDLLSFLGMKIKRVDTSVKIKNEVLWGSYLGSESNGVFRRKHENN